MTEPVLQLRKPDTAHRPGWLELLFDLAFVVALGSTAHTLVDMEMPEGLFRYAVIFLLMTWAWSTYTFFVGIFAGSEEWHGLALAQMALVLLLATLRDPFGSDFDEFVIVYTLLRLLNVGMYLRAWLLVPEVRWLTGIQSVGIALTLLPLWLGWNADDQVSRQQLLLIAALIPIAVAPLAFLAHRSFAFNAAHTLERVGLFVTLSLGECFLAIARAGDAVGFVSLAALVHGALAVFVVFALWRIYFGMLEGAGFQGQHRRAVFWMVLHLPLVMCIIGLATGLERNLVFLAEQRAAASDRLLIAWGVAVLTVVALGMFWGEGKFDLRALLWRAVATLTAGMAIAVPFLSASLLSPQAALYFLFSASLLVMAINPSVKPWGYGKLPDRLGE